jgi:glutamate racemase
VLILSKNFLEMTNKEKPIIIFDSGVGGLPYLELARIKLPLEHFIYLADTKHFPYGDKSEDKIREAVIESVTKAIKQTDPKCVVIACNTASVVALKDLRERFPLSFIGVVPAVKPAATFSQRMKIGVLATRQTVKNRYLHNLIRDFADGYDVAIVPAGRVTELVEYSYFKATEIDKQAVLHEVVKEIKERGVDSVVLACTHFLLLEKEFKRVLGDGINLIDSREGVINQLIRVLDTNGLRSEKREGEHTLFTTGSDTRGEQVNTQYLLFAEKYGLQFAGVI